MSFCSIKSCKSTSRNCKGTDVYFHQLQSSSELRKLLKSNVKGKTKSVCVCSKHFLESDYVRDLKSELLGTDKRKILVSGAFPSVNLGDKNNETNESDSIDVSQNVSSAVASNTGISTLDSSEASWRTKVGILCRLCAKSDYGCVPIFKGKSVDDEVKMKIEKYLYIQLNEEDGLPDQVCPGCLTAVSAWHIFAEECLKVNVKLQELLSNEESQELSTLRKKGQKNGKSSEAFMPDQRCAEEGNGDTDIKTEIIKEEIDIEENSLRTAGNTQFENVSLVVVPENLWNSARKSVDPLHTTGKVKLTSSSQKSVRSNQGRHGNKTVKKKTNEDPEVIELDTGVGNRMNGDSLDSDSDIPAYYDEIDKEIDSADTHENWSSESDNEDNVQSNLHRDPRLSKKLPLRNPVKKANFSKILVKQDLTKELADVGYDTPSKTMLESILTKAISNIKSQDDISVANTLLLLSSDQRKPVAKTTNDEEEEYVQCRVCDEYCSKPLLHKHMRSHKYCCSICYNVSPSKEIYLQHKKQHLSGSMCEVCGKILKSDTNLQFHRKTHLPDELREKYKCDICGVEYKHLDKLKKHLQWKHLSQKMHICETCEKPFRSPELLKIHLKVHSENRPHICPHCNKGFKWTKNLNQHVNSVHVGIKSTKKKYKKTYPFKSRPAVCHLCGNILKSGHALRRHILSHEGVKLFKCTVCGKEFTTNNAKIYHERIHTGEKPFKCDKCDKSFRSNALLKAHYHIHTNTMPYRCKFCDRCFRRPGTLIMHERIHTGDKRYSCHVCSRAFIQKGDRDKHILTHFK